MLKEPSFRAAFRLSGYYLAFGLCWILFSDLALDALIPDHELHVQMQTFKGWFYVGLTALLLFIWSRRAFIRIRSLADHDSLTGLKNRSWAVQFGNQKVLQGESFHLVVLDIDDFQSLNDVEGHHHGDSTLIHVASELLAYMPKGCEIARIGGDEFAVFDPVSTQQEVRDYLHKLTTDLTPDYASDELQQLSVSIGVAHYPGHGLDFKELLKRSELAVHQAKFLGKSQVVHYQADMQKKLHETIELTRALRKAIAKRELQVMYQPQFDTVKNQIIGVEALARWTHEGEMISPGVFIPLAEQAGIITELTQVMMEKAIEELSGAGLLGQKLLKLSINLSPIQFNSPDGVSALLQLMNKHQHVLHHLTLEMTESAIMKNLDGAASVLEQLVKGGAEISVDDFGTGYSSFGLLKELPIHELKIDRSLIKDITHDSNDEKIVKAVIAMSDALGLKLIAEGVETEGQSRTLQKNGCSLVQGFLYAKPMELVRLQEFVS